MKVKKILFDENTPDDIIKEYIEMGFKPYLLSRRKIKRGDKKVWNRLKKLNMNPDTDLKFRNDGGYCGIVNEEDPVYTFLKECGEPISKYKIIRKKPIEDIYKENNDLYLANEDFRKIEEEMKNGVDLKFVTVKIVYTYELRDEFKGENKIIGTTRDFCRDIISLNRAWTLDEIKSIDTKHLSRMGLPNDVFVYTGGWYRRPGTTDSRPFCRHQWVSNVVIEN